MKRALLQSKVIIVLFVCFFLNNYSAFAQKTTVWFVRHAEKEAATPQSTDDPGLSPDGRKRADALAKFLKRQKIKAIFITKFKRTAETARAVATQNKVTPQVYGDTLKAFAEGTLRTYSGSNLLVIGHSNTLMPLLGAFGSELPFEELDDNDYDMVFKVTIKDWGKRELEISYYGTLHHKSDLPQKYLEDDRPAQQFTAPATHY